MLHDCKDTTCILNSVFKVSMIKVITPLDLLSHIFLSTSSRLGMTKSLNADYELDTFTFHLYPQYHSSVTQRHCTSVGGI